MSITIFSKHFSACVRRWLPAFMVLCSMAIAGEASAALSASSYAASSRLASGRWVKIKVSQSGMHQITDAQLRAMGFADPSKVAVYGFPSVSLSTYRLTSACSDDLPAVPSIRHNDKIIFYAEADVMLDAVVNAYGNRDCVAKPLRNYYADFATYFLTDSQDAVAPATLNLPTAGDGNEITEAIGIYHYEDELYNTDQIGARFFGQPLTDGDQTLSLTMPGYLGTESETPVVADFYFGAVAENSSSIAVQLPDGSSNLVSVSYGTSSLFAYRAATATMTFTTPVADKYDIVMSVAGRTSITYAALDYLALSYPRTTAFTAGAAQETLVFPTLLSTDYITIADAPEQLMVWDISDRNAPAAFATERTDAGLKFGWNKMVSATSAGGAATAIAFNPDAELLPVEFAGETPNSNLHGASTPQMLIVAAENFMEQAERLADLHRRFDGLDVMVVQQENIYNEFSSGTPHPMAIRRMANMFSLRNPGRLRSILLFGGALWDNRGIGQAFSREELRATYIPMFTREDLEGAGRHAESYITDAFYGMLNETTTSKFIIGRERQTVPVGRIPCIDLGAAISAVNNVEKYLSEGSNDNYNRALLMSDRGDTNGHLIDSDELAATIIKYSPSTTIYKGANAVFPYQSGESQDIFRLTKEALTKGIGFWAYSGHATQAALGIEQLWSTTKAKSVEYAYPPFVFLATCRALLFDHPSEFSLGEAMLYNDKGGSVGIIGALREVYKEQNQSLNVAIGKAFYTADDGTTVGEILRSARNTLVPNTSSETETASVFNVIVNTLCYNLAGDPELRFRAPSASVVVTDLGGAMPDEEEATVETLKETSVAGEIHTAGGNIDTEFNGMLVLTAYDAPRVVPVINKGEAETAITPGNTVLDHTSILEKKIPVVNGRFSGSFLLPTVTPNDTVSRITFYAIDDATSRSAAGVLSAVAMRNPADLDPELSDDTAPEITDMYINTPAFTDGDYVDGLPVLHVNVRSNIFDVVANSNQYGRSAIVLIDNSHTLSGVNSSFRTDENGGGSLQIPITDLSDGRHTATFRIFNTMGQSASRTISFTYIALPEPAVLDVEVDAANSVATVALSSSLEGDNTGRLVVKNDKGEVVVHRAETSFPTRIDLKDAEGTPLPNGPYTVEAYLTNGVSYTVAPAVTVVLHR